MAMFFNYPLIELLYLKELNHLLMKKISVGGWIVGIIDLIAALILLLMFITTAEGIDMDRVLDEPKSYFPIICLVAGLFKLLGIILIWTKKKAGNVFYFIGCFAFMTFLFIATSEYEFGHSDENIPLLIIYGLIALQFLFIYIMSKAIKPVQ